MFHTLPSTMHALKSFLVVCTLSVAIAACDSSDPEPPPGTPTGTLEVTAATTGDTPDPNGYTVTLDGEESREVNPDGSVTFEDVAEGEHDVQLSGVADNCSVDAGNPRTVTVTAEEITETTFDVTCVEPPPTIDGEKNAGEWDDATSVSVESVATFWYQNDGDNLYLALEATDATLHDDDEFYIRFDNDHDGTLDPAEENLAVEVSGGLSDRRSDYIGVGWGAEDDQQDGDGAWSRAGDVYFFELVHPLNSGDSDDFSLSSGDTVGYCVVYYNFDGTSGHSFQFPIGCPSSGADLSGYAAMTVE